MFRHVDTPEDRLRVWREIRHQNYDTVEELLEQFASLKPHIRYIDYYTPSSWPNPFEIVSEGMFCLSGITIVIAATLHYKQFITDEDITFLVISNNIDGTDGVVLQHKDNVYNFIPGQVVTRKFLEKNAVIYDRHIIDLKQIFS
jgi:hypothetical protein